MSRRWPLGSDHIHRSPATTPALAPERRMSPLGVRVRRHVGATTGRVAGAGLVSGHHELCGRGQSSELEDVLGVCGYTW